MNYELEITNCFYDKGKNSLMKTDNIIQVKSYAFAVRIVLLYQYLSEKKNEFVLTKQVLRAGTSIGPILKRQ